MFVQDWWEKLIYWLMITKKLAVGDERFVFVFTILSPLRLCPCRTRVQGCRRCTLCPQRSKEKERRPRFQRQTGSSGPPGRRRVIRWGGAGPTPYSPSGSSEPGCQQMLCRRPRAPENIQVRVHSVRSFSVCVVKLWNTLAKKRTKSPTVLIADTRKAFSTRMSKASRAEVQKLVLLMAVAV